MNTLTPLGKFLRKLRIDRGELLAGVAADLSLSASMLSAVELGRKPAPNALLEKIAERYELSPIAKEDLKQLAKESAPQVRIGLEGANDPARELAVAFARRFKSLDAQEVDQMLSLLKTKNKSSRGG